jgi:CTP:molybdopterin cytidylyltransferase MocA
MSARIGGVVLGAGSSRRLGGPKALAAVGGRTFLDRTLESLALGGCGRLWVVIGGPHEAALRRHLVEVGATGCIPRPELVTNPAPALGMWSSLRVGLAAVAPLDMSALVVALVDHPSVAPQTVARLIAAHEAAAPGAALRVVPTWQGRGGHPYLLDAGLIPRLLAYPPACATYEVLRRVPMRRIATDDPAVVEDLDTPERLAAIGAKLPGRQV